MRILVTGGAGFIGSHLVERLNDLNNEILVLDDLSAGMYENLTVLKGRSVEIVKGSIVSNEIVQYCMKDVDKVFHLAAKTNVDESLLFPELFDDVNSKGTLNIIKAAKERNVPVVSMSTSEAYGTALYVPINEEHPLNPQSPYAASKVAAERYCYSFVSAYDSKIVIIRSFNNYGPRQKGNVLYGGLIASNIIRVLLGYAPVIRGGRQSRDYMFVKDTVDALVIAGFKESCYGKVLNLGTGIGYTATEIVNLILELTESKVRPKIEDARAGDVERLVCDSSRAFAELGWKPKYDLRTGLKETIEWYRHNLRRFEEYTFPSFRQKL
jgi:UDP-glucose 4-epimerase